MSDHDFRPGKKVIVAAVIMVAATYAYFLLFAQFGFLNALQIVTGGQQGVIKRVLTVMGGAGIVGSGLAAFIFTPQRGRSTLIAGFVGCAIAAGVSLSHGPGWIYYLVALVVGLGVGATTVTLAGLLRRVVGGRRLGAVIGFGTGIAYGFCNLPPVFNASPVQQAVLSLVIAGIGALAALGLVPCAAEPAPAGFDYSKAGIATWVLFFSMLVGLDSAVFYVIQHTPAFKNETWSGSMQLGMNGVVHLCAAVLVGYALDRGWLGRTMLLAVVLLLGACELIGGIPVAAGVGALLYTTAVSIYSVALVFYSAFAQKPGIAALVYAVAGWSASAAGIGLAENLRAIPHSGVLAAGGVAITALVVRHIFIERSFSRA